MKKPDKSSDRREVELWIYSNHGRKDLINRFFKKVYWVSSASLRMLLKIGTKIPPVARGLREGVVRNVVRPKGCLIRISIETNSHVEDLLERLSSPDWEQTPRSLG